MKALLIACDFDGTVTQRDTLHVIVEAFGDPQVWDALEPALHAGEMTVEDALTRQFATVHATPDDVRRIVAARAPMRRGFVDFIDWARGEGHEVLVLSNGFRSVIEPVLDDAGLHDLEVVANDCSFSSEGAVIRWDDRGPRCTACDRPCKRAPLAERRAGRTTVMIGDGISDRCVAGVADRVFARDFLARDLASRGRPFTHFDDFDQVRGGLAQMEAAS